MVKFIWQHNVPLRFCGYFKMLDFWCSKVKTLDPLKPQNESQKSEPTWLLKYLITLNFFAKFQGNRLTTNFGPWNTFSDSDTLATIKRATKPCNLLCHFAAKRVVRKQCCAFYHPRIKPDFCWNAD